MLDYLHSKILQRFYSKITEIFLLSHRLFSQHSPLKLIVALKFLAKLSLFFISRANSILLEQTRIVLAILSFSCSSTIEEGNLSRIYVEIKLIRERENPLVGVFVNCNKVL